MSLFAQTTTTLLSSQLTQDEPSPFSVGGLMFFFVTAVILVGALVLYLRNRRPRDEVRP